MGESIGLRPHYTKLVTPVAWHTSLGAVLYADFNGENSSSLSVSKKKLYAKYSPSEKPVFSSFSSENDL